MNAVVETVATSALESFVSVLSHVDHLNEWVRSDSCRTLSRTSTRNVVYHFKNEAIKQAQAFGLTTHRLVAITLVCRDCGGRKRYTDQYGYTHDGCRLCSSSGCVKLRFVETTIECASIRWHSPTEYRHDTKYFGDWRTWPEERVSDDWMPNQKGRDLTPDEAATSLMAVEVYFPTRPGKRTVYWDFACEPVDDFTHYKLHLGKTDPERCCLCLRCEALSTCGIGCSVGRIEWTAVVCKTCQALWPGVEIFRRCEVNVPQELLTPAVREWIRTRRAATGTPQ